MDEDRLHLNPVGHQAIAIAVLDALHADHALAPLPVPAGSVLSARERRAANLAWARRHMAPWVHRRITGRSSGDGVQPKRPDLAPVEAADRSPAATGRPPRSS
jgi:hypothetical protein